MPKAQEFDAAIIFLTAQETNFVMECESLLLHLYCSKAF